MLLGAMALFGATLTLPGIAGFILTIGMAVDSNVLIFERIREELRAGRAPKTAIENGFSKAFATIIDTHLDGHHLGDLPASSSGPDPSRGSRSPSSSVS